MWLRRLAVAHWRGLSFDLGGLSPGLNLVCGPNEAGKSRLVEALRFALFESSSGKAAHKKALETWGAAPGKPRVSVEFELAGTVWKLDKEFLGTGHNTRLRSDRETLSGAEAEGRLAALMGVGPGGSKELKAEDRGIWSLLWVDQGASREAPAHNADAQAQLQDRLTQEIGEVAAGTIGQQILERAREQRERFYTPKAGVEKTVLTELRDRVNALGARLDEATARRDAIAADADELDRLRGAERDLQARLATAEQRLGDVRGQHELVSELARQLDVYEEQVRTRESQRDRAAAALESAEALAAQIARLTEQQQAALSAQQAAEAARSAAQRAVDRAAQAAAETDARYAEQERQVRQLRRARELATLRAQAERLRQRLNEAEAVQARIASLRDSLARLPAVSAEQVARLRQSQEQRDSARARLEGAAASVELEAHQDLTLSGEDLARGTRRRLLVDDEAHLEVDGVLSLTVRAGGGELPKLRDALRDAERTLASALQNLGVADIAGAERLAEQRRDQQAELERSQRELERQLPEGREQVETELRALEAQLEGAPDRPEAPLTAEALAQAETALEQQAAERDDLRARRDVAQEQLSSARETAAAHQSELASLARHLEEAATRRQTVPDTDVLAKTLEDAARALGERVAARDELERQFEAKGGDDLALDLEQATRSVEQLKVDLQQLRMNATRLVARLESAGDDGRHEQVQELAAELTRAETELATVERQASAALRLHDVLQDEYARARERLAQPVIARIRPYLQSLFPETELWLDDELRLLGLRGRDAEQNFDALSGGAREQLSLLVRIGLAEVIGADEPRPLVLDDVLVNTDAERIQRVQRLVFQASKRMQILLFTCHGPLFDGLGADVRIELPAPPRIGQKAASETVSAG